MSEKLDDYSRGYLEAIMQAQKNLFGAGILDESVKSDFFTSTINFKSSAFPPFFSHKYSAKRPDLLVDATLKLPEELFQKCDFTFVGSQKNADTEISGRISEFAELFFNVRFLPALYNWSILH